MEEPCVDATNSHEFIRDLRPIAEVVAGIQERFDKLKRENPSWRQHPLLADIARLLRLQERGEDLEQCENCEVPITPENFNVCGTCYNKTVKDLLAQRDSARDELLKTKH